ncbi:MAG TPA: hypothetical protein VMV84_01220 [Dehalococcoidales bacterium]|nr:hypothetical protein [Dehalococcoidales bacterium]
MAWDKIYEKTMNSSYRGPAEQCDYTFSIGKPDQWGARQDAIKHMEAHIIELQKQGQIVLEYYLWEDRSPTFQTDYYCRVVASDTTGNALPWGLIIVAVLVIIALFVIYHTIKQVKQIFEYLGPAGATAMSFAVAGIVGITLIGMVYLIAKPKPSIESKPRKQEGI